jgi:putative inorganic carbon (hco3(-)) transporter
MKEDLMRLGGVVGALGVALLMVAPPRRWRIGALACWALGCGMLAIAVAPAGHHRAIAAAAGVGVIVAVLLGLLFLKVPWAIAVAVLACAPARIPVTLGSSTYNLLLPLYVVVAGVAVALGVELVAPEWAASMRTGRVFTPRGRHTGEESEAPHPPDESRPLLGPFAWPAAILTGWSGIAILWSEGTKPGAIYLLFYLLPLALMAVALARVPWRIGAAKFLYVELTAMALVFAAIGADQYLTRNIYWNPKVKVDNALAPVGWFYRVNSVFYDPSIYGRFLVVAILASIALVLFARANVAYGAAAAAAAITVGLLPSFSQSSYFALAVGIAAALIVLWRRKAILPLVIAAAVLVLVTMGVPQLRHRILGKAGVSHATSGRSTLVSTGADLFFHHPLIGVGTGGFVAGYAKETHKAGHKSHTAPVTVAAETGVIGIAALLWLLWEGLTVPFRRNRGVTSAGRARLAFGLALLAIVVHSLFYNALIEDPLFWALLALSAVAYRLPEAERG